MGYTHYFSRSSNSSAQRWGLFIDEVKELLAHPAICDLVCREYNQPGIPPVISDTEVRFNGKGELGHETFLLTRVAHRGFCKTGGLSQMDYVESWGKHYDVAVCCVLLSANHHLKEKVGSDGDWSEEGWMRARALYAKVTSKLVSSPWPEKCCSQCNRFFARDRHNWGGSKVCHKCGGGSYQSSNEITTCSKCHAKNSFRKAKPETWCWYCCNGYKGKEDAAVALAKRWSDITEALRKMDLRRRDE